ncbi:uncharacterized protein LTR77_006711 [Saxophila tyrrhenica]|uniref:Uncharacterized protein n=1 Tax=Saxophila tyrrhenica TaxID=1690608 RepID=A0AAV9P9E4_9PEZI|nr:hypothetical protein LTR77_006711 [Saxophila tyrrhenica]
MPPPATPSPHRFLKGHRRQEPPASRQKPPSALRQQIDREPPAQPQETPTTLSQFNAPPRFSVGKRRPVAPPTQRSPSPQKHSLVNTLRSTGRPVEDVEDAQDQADDEEMLDLEQADVRPTTEHQDRRDWTSDLALSPKRRRLDPHDDTADTTQRSYRPEEHPRARPSASVPPFATPKPPETSTITTAPQRPAFLRPSAPPQEPSEPLPETFSPHKRGQKFVPGGMAATVQQWVIETGQAAVQSRRGHGYLKGENYVAKVKVDEVLGQGPFTVLGKNAEMEAVALLLAGKVKEDDERTGLKQGDVLGVRAPTWEVEVDGRSWCVGVDWKVMS